MFSGSIHARFLTVLAEKCTRPRTLQFSCISVAVGGKGATRTG
jgi:hypothetical protein